MALFKDIKVGQKVSYDDTFVSGEAEVIFCGHDDYVDQEANHIMLLLPVGCTKGWRINSAIDYEVNSAFQISSAFRETYKGRIARWCLAKHITILADFAETPACEPPSYNCIVCNYGDKFTTSANLTENRFLCFSCRASYGYKYRGCFL